MSKGIGDRFQEETKYARGKMSGRGLDWSRMPEPFKTYPGAPRIVLPAATTEGGAGLWEVLRHRRSVREFGRQTISRAELSQLLWAAQGVTAKMDGYALRTAPSAGALYPVETYLSVHAVEDIPQGLYHYEVRGHALEQIQVGDFRTAVAQAALEQEMVYYAGVVFIWTAIFQRSKWKYDQRAFRYVYLDAGHIAQNVALAAVALGLGSCQIAALYDDEMNGLLGVDGRTESTIYMTVVGRPEG
ncbi:MAG: SagB/ThcOx family dehydrogenase [Candidatus Sumerlaeia bacterium]|nr:SagB/ThcOx family dehydrogenase [Candidatus Sumerlaeia bacterium]